MEIVNNGEASLDGGGIVCIGGCGLMCLGACYSSFGSLTYLGMEVGTLASYNVGG